jgi:hypothetical protein
MNAQKTPLGGRPISRKEAFKGLGDPKTWKKFSDAVYAEFRAKPKIKQAAGSLVTSAIEKLKKVIYHGTGKKMAPVYAKRFKRRKIKKPSKMRSSKVKRRQKK